MGNIKKNKALNLKQIAVCIMLCTGYVKLEMRDVLLT